MVDMPQLKVGWDCPICHWVGEMVFQSVNTRRDEALFVLKADDDSNQYIKEHIKVHLAEIRKMWQQVEGTLGALGYSMDIQIDKRIDPGEEPVVDAPGKNHRDNTWDEGPF